LSNQPPSARVAVVRISTLALEALTASLAKLPIAFLSVPIRCSTFSAKARTTGASSSSYRPATRAASGSIPREEEEQWKK
jgi:hypothetical protein